MQQATDYVSCGFDKADVIICIGFDMVEYHLVAEMQEHSENSTFPIKPQKILWDLRQALAPKDIVISES